MIPACHRVCNIHLLSHPLSISAIRRVFVRPTGRQQTEHAERLPTVSHKRCFATGAQPANVPTAVEHVVVLGGGITGLATAFHLSRRIPQAKITIVEDKKRTGGWIRSEHVNLGPEKGHMVLEGGPRTLRPQSEAVLELIHLLGLENGLVITPNTSAAAQKRFLYLSGGDGKGLTALPSTPTSVFTSPFFKLLFPSVFAELIRPPNRIYPIPVPPEKREELSYRMKVYDDESVDSFLSRRFGPKVARVLGSAVVHGIWAADSRDLSVRASFPSLWGAEDRGWGGVIRGILRGIQSKAKEGLPYEVGDLPHKLKGASVFSLRDGMSALTDRLLERLKENPNIRVLIGTGATSLQPNANSVTVQLRDGSTLQASHVVSTIPLPKLYEIIPPPVRLPHLTHNPYTSVTVVNFIFDKPPFQLHPDGFGYLIPRPIAGYTGDSSSTDSPTSGILGTVFDSVSLSGQDAMGAKTYTKLTMMCGGPYGAATVPSVDKLLDRLFIHLNKSRVEPVEVRVHEHKECIPTPLVGHLDRMKELKAELRGEHWGRKLIVIGAGVNGAAVPDCVESAREAAKEILETR